MKTPIASKLLTVGAVLVICLAIFASVSSSKNSNQEGRSRTLRANSASAQPNHSTVRTQKELVNRNHLLRSLTQPLGLPAASLSNLLVPQAVGPESIATYADDCTTPKTDFNFGDTICAVVSNVRVGAHERLWWGHTDGFLAREVFLNSVSQTDTFVLTPTSVLGGQTVNNRGTWRILSIDVDGAPVADTTFTIHDPANVTGDLSVYKFNQQGLSKVDENSNINFVISVSNFGPDTASNVSLNDFVPDVTTFVSLTQLSGPTFTCVDSTCTIASLPKDARANFLAVYHTNGVASETLTSYTASISSDTAELRPEDNTASGDFSILTAGAPQACTLNCPDNVNATANSTVSGQRGAVVTFDAAEPSGDCGAVTASPASGSFFPVGTTTVTVSSATGGGSCSFTVTVTDNGTNPPSISCPASQAVNANSSCEAVVTVGNPSTSGGDNVTVVGTRSDGKSLYTCDVNGQNCTRKTTDDPFATGINTITWTAYSHNTPGPYATAEDEEAARTGSASCNQTITVNDVTPPVINVSAQTIAADANCQAVVPDFTTTAGFSVSDNCACASSDQSESCQSRQDIAVVQSPAAGTPVGLGTYTITLSANDGSSNNGGAGNTTTVQTTLTVADQTAPSISCPSDVVVYLPLNTPDTSMAVSFPAATASDNCSTPTITYDHASGSVFSVGTTTVTATATDAAGNHSSCSFHVTVLYDFTGFFSPVTNPPTLNIVNAGKAVPVKFSLSGNKGLAIFAAGNPYSISLNCSTSDPGVDVTETLNAGGSSLSFSGDQYNYVWKTDSSWAGTCRQLVLTLNDGSVHTANFKFK
jgi:uncharacterized repeat protein (TIGR01451 family)